MGWVGPYWVWAAKSQESPNLSLWFVSGGILQQVHLHLTLHRVHSVLQWNLVNTKSINTKTLITQNLFI